MMKQTLLAVVLICSANSSFSDTQSLEDFIVQQLRCRAPAQPLPILESLENAGKIRASEMIGFDSVSCFRIHGGFLVNGLRFDSLCGHEESPAIRDLRPDLLWRGPGTSPGQFVSFGTGANFETAQRWYFENVGKEFLNQAIDTEGTNIGDNTDISCTSWF